MKRRQMCFFLLCFFFERLVLLSTANKKLIDIASLIVAKIAGLLPTNQYCVAFCFIFLRSNHLTAMDELAGAKA